MAYRVLTPWVVTWVERWTGLPRVGIYQGAKMGLNTLAFWAVGLAWGSEVMLLTVILLLLTVKFDYWSWAPELAGIAMAMTGQLPYALAGGLIAGLSKETALMVPVTYFLRTMDAGGAGVVLIATWGLMIAIKLLIGQRELYCERWQIRYNLSLFKSFINREFWRQGQWYHQDIFIALVLSLLVAVQSVLRPEPASLIPMALLAAGWSLAKADETRIFSAALPWVALLMLGR
jgi:hypothetical protein